MSEMIDDNMGLEFQAWLAEAPGRASIGESSPVLGTACKGIVISELSEVFDTEQPLSITDFHTRVLAWVRTIKPKVLAVDASTQRAAAMLLDYPEPFAFSFPVFVEIWPEFADLLESKAGQEWRSDGQ